MFGRKSKEISKLSGLLEAKIRSLQLKNTDLEKQISIQSLVYLKLKDENKVLIEKVRNAESNFTKLSIDASKLLNKIEEFRYLLIKDFIGD